MRGGKKKKEDGKGPGGGQSVPCRGALHVGRGCLQIPHSCARERDHTVHSAGAGKAEEEEEEETTTTWQALGGSKSKSENASHVGLRGDEIAATERMALRSSWTRVYLPRLLPCLCFKG